MQMICANTSCSNVVTVTQYGDPVSLVCPKCGGLRVMFDEDVEISDPHSKGLIGKLQQGKSINAEEIRDVRQSPYRRAFLLRGLGGVSRGPSPPSPIPPPPPPPPPQKKEELTGVDAIPKPKPIAAKHKRPRGRPRKGMRPVT